MKTKCRETVRKRNVSYPLIGTRCTYLGEDTEFFINGNVYRVIGIDDAYCPDMNTGFFLTDEQSPKDTMDTDYGRNIGLPYFNSHFKVY